MRKREKSAKERFLELVRRRSVVEERNWRRLLNLYEHTESAYQHLFDELMSLRQVSGEFTAIERDEVTALMTNLSKMREQFLGTVVRACSSPTE